MLSLRTRLAFSIENVYAGFAKVSGLLRVHTDLVVLEFETRENLFGGVLKSKPKQVHIPLEEIESVRLKKRWFSTHLIIRVYRLNYLENIPGSEKGEVKLKLTRKDRKEAEKMISRIDLRISELKLDKSERGEDLY